MRSKYLYAVTLIITLQGCSPKPVFRLMPEAEHTTFNQGTEYVHQQQNGIELTLSYYQHLSKRFMMDVEIVNRTDSVIRVDPTQFSYDAYRGFKGEIPSDSVQSITFREADNPEKELLEVDKALSRAEASQKTNDLFYVATQGVAIAGAVAADTEEGRDEWKETQEDLYYSRQNNQLNRSLKRGHLQNRRSVWEIDALRKTDVYPGEYIRGYLFFKTNKKAYGYIIHYRTENTSFDIYFKQRKYSAEKARHNPSTYY